MACSRATCWALLLLLPCVASAGRQTREISTSGGETDGVVVLWPRVIPASRSARTRQAAWQVQQQLARLVREAVPHRSVDVRPEPERVCPQGGCVVPRVGALVVHHRKGCAVVGLVGGPGEAPLTLVPWVGVVQLASPTVAFRGVPEAVVNVSDFGRCDALGTPLSEGADAMRQAIRSAAAPPSEEG